jgi:hypothetical protein
MTVTVSLSSTHSPSPHIFTETLLCARLSAQQEEEVGRGLGKTDLDEMIPLPETAWRREW